MNEMWTNIIIGAIGSILATILVLLTRLGFYKIRDMFPARALFQGIAGTDALCRVFIIRMTDTQRSGQFLTPVPRYAVATKQQEFQGRQLTRWVTSTAEAQSVAHVLNVLGRAGRTDNIEIAFVDEDFDDRQLPTIILVEVGRQREHLPHATPSSASLLMTLFACTKQGRSFALAQMIMTSVFFRK